MKFCSQCGAPLGVRVPRGDDRERAFCPQCDTVHYENPKNVVGCMVEHEGRLLLCRRAIEPAEGLWTPPAGFLEMRESAVEGAVRETREEACAEVEVLALHAQLDLPHISQHYALYRTRLKGDHFAAGIESHEVKLFDPADVPWDEVAFPVMYFALKLWMEDRERGRPRVHHGVVHWNGQGSRLDWRQFELRDHLGVDVVE